jgi:predicted ribosomally synthesized peptide with SipW-like signal peptide
VKKIIFAVLSVAVAIGLMGAAFAYFTDVEKSTGNTMSAGTLNIEIANPGGTFSNDPVTGTFNSPPGLKPGDVFETGPVYLENVGSITIERIYARFCGFSEVNGTPAEFPNGADINNISDYLVLQSYSESNNAGSNYYEEVFDTINAEAYEQYWATHGATGIVVDGKITLRELVLAAPGGSGGGIACLCMFDGGNVPSDPPLAPGMIAAFKFKFKLMETANNCIQGDTVNFNVNFIASMNDTYPDTGLDEDVTEPLDPLW